MIEPRPLTKDERESLESIVEIWRKTGAGWALRLAEAEQFWREAIKNDDALDLFDTRSRDTLFLCRWCKNLMTHQIPAHKEECPWQLAQE